MLVVSYRSGIYWGCIQVPDAATPQGVPREQFWASTGTSVECWEGKKMCQGEIGGFLLVLAWFDISSLSDKTVLEQGFWGAGRTYTR